MAKRTDRATEEAIAEEYAEGVSVTNLATRFGLARATVQAILGRRGVAQRSPGRPGDPDRDAKLVTAWELCGRAGRAMVAEDFGYSSVASARHAVHMIRLGRRGSSPSPAPLFQGAGR